MSTDDETLRRALANLAALFADPAQMERVGAELRAIGEEAARRKRAVLEREGLPVELAEKLSGDSTLTPKEPYATIPPMSTSFIPTPRKTGRPLGDGPVAAVAKRLGMSMDGIARAIGFSRNTVKTWNARGKIPDDAQVKIDALKPAKSRRAK